MGSRSGWAERYQTHGDDPSTHADVFRRQMEKFSIPSQLTVIKDAPHPFLGKQVWFDEMVETADAFFINQLKNPKLP